jgi:hypothetical protein
LRFSRASVHVVNGEIIGYVPRHIVVATAERDALAREAAD